MRIAVVMTLDRIRDSRAEAQPVVTSGRKIGLVRASQNKFQKNTNHGMNSLSKR